MKTLVYAIVYNTIIVVWNILMATATALACYVLVDMLLQQNVNVFGVIYISFVALFYATMTLVIFTWIIEGKAFVGINGR